MNKKLIIIYLIVFFFSSLVYISKTDFTFMSYKNEKPLYIKYFFIWISTLLITYSLYITNNTINNYILPIFLFFNIGILLIISINNDKFKNKLHLISLIGIVYLLITFSSINNFKVKNGELININENWFYLYIPILILWFVTSSYLSLQSKIICILLILYPLLYPLNEYFIHRLFSLVAVYLLLNLPKKYKLL
jgi:hypothetical protein